ncbi:hypothetical protein BSZ35_00065 [Salinibacter sp. 10B]|uniref:hypothetical protein n=1 Tax=Salinibacter sp. 10B TaxID=1923971 RepID=UPI000CF4186C|nr:hypothetical protein [Salinibacter sp. 10B]PQJ36784.1 hypothetical protein BSZ35_00065 [Salinibacter sp. 10B]
MDLPEGLFPGFHETNQVVEGTRKFIVLVFREGAAVRFQRAPFIGRLGWCLLGGFAYQGIFYVLSNAVCRSFRQARLMSFFLKLGFYLWETLIPVYLVVEAYSDFFN